ncbi:MAG: hypothetical protein GKR77_06340 [Legionellales bacterium]|nr:hypothetical protein [Legionellales bacterium]
MWRWLLTQNSGKTHEISDHIQLYIDYDAFARDLFINDYFSVTIDHRVHVFSNY